MKDELIDNKTIDRILFVATMSSGLKADFIKLIKDRKNEFHTIINRLLSNDEFDDMAIVRRETYFPYVFKRLNQALEYAGVENKHEVMAYLIMLYLDEYDANGYAKQVVTKYAKKYGVYVPPPKKIKKKVNYKYNYVQVFCRSTNKTDLKNAVKYVNSKLGDATEKKVNLYSRMHTEFNNKGWRNVIIHTVEIIAKYGIHTKLPKIKKNIKNVEIEIKTAAGLITRLTQTSQFMYNFVDEKPIIQHVSMMDKIHKLNSRPSINKDATLEEANEQYRKLIK